MISIPAGTVAVEVEDMSLDRLCFEYVQRLTGDRRLAGKLTAYVAATLSANPGLAAQGAILTRGTSVNLPAHVIASPTAQTKRLWD